MWKKSWGVLGTWQMRQCSLFHPAKVMFLSFLVFMESEVKKPRFPWGKVKLMKLTIWGKNLEKNSINSSTSYHWGGLPSCFFTGFAVWQCFQLSPCRIYGQAAFFFSLYLSVCHISLKSRPCQSDSWFLSPSIGSLQHIIHGITLEDPPVDLILCILLFPLLSIACNSA